MTPAQKSAVVWSCFELRNLIPFTLGRTSCDLERETNDEEVTLNKWVLTQISRLNSIYSLKQRIEKFRVKKKRNN